MLTCAAIAHGQTEGTDRGATNGGRHPTCRADVAAGQPDVVGHQQGRAPTHTAPAVGCGRAGPRSGRRTVQASRRSSGSVGSPSPGPYRKLGTASSAAAHAAKASRAAMASAMVDPRSATKGTTSTTPRRGWTPSWVRRSSRVDRLPGHGPWGVLTDQGEDGAVVVGVAVQVEQVPPSGAGEASSTSPRRPSLTLTTHSNTGPSCTTRSEGQVVRSAAWVHRNG